MSSLALRERPTLRGREGELDLIRGVLRAARAGRGGALLVRGTAGVGKTALLDTAVRAVEDSRVLRAAGVEFEAELPFGALHQLCAPVLEQIGRLPTPQRVALETAFGLRAGEDAPADQFRVALGVLTLLSEVAERRGLICVIDDVQWLDQASVKVLAFIARRIEAEPIAMLLAARDPLDRDELSEIPELRLEGLGADDARSLLDSAIHAPLDQRVRGRILAEARGNPLALLELPRSVRPDQLAGGYGALDEARVQEHVEDSFRGRLRDLSRDTRLLLLLAAAEPLGEPALLWRAAELLGIGEAAATGAEAAGLLQIGVQVRFRHPLVRSAVYRAATVEDRRRVHAALAEATDAATDPDRRAWHRAQATGRPDECVAAELERSAGRARARGGLAAAGAFLERAAELTPSEHRRASRVLSAAQAEYVAGATQATQRLLAAAASGPLDEFQRARLERFRAGMVFSQQRGADAVLPLFSSAQRLVPLDRDLARDTFLDALDAAVLAGRFGSRPNVREIAEAARGIATTSERPQAGDLLLEGLARRLTEGYAAAVPALRRALRLLVEPYRPGTGDNPWPWIGCRCAMDLWDATTWQEVASRHVHALREAGALTALPVLLNYLAMWSVHAGAFAAAAAQIDEADAVSDVTGIPPVRDGTTMLWAWGGQRADALQLLEAIGQDAARRGEGRALAMIDYATAVLRNGAGNYDKAYEAAKQAADHGDLVYSTWSLPEVVEAAARTGRAQAAVAALEQLSGMASASGTPWALGLAARSRALLCESTAAEDLYVEAIERLAGVPPQLGRARLLYGEWLRRERRRGDARQQLRDACSLLDEIGAAAFAARAAHELRAAGEQVTKKRETVDAAGGLTAQELRVARLVATGATSKEVAAELFLSPRTIDAHLRSIFRKLGVTSRRQIRQLHLPG
jgi:DNA-binding CsgD family transcriptional regulator